MNGMRRMVREARDDERPKDSKMVESMVSIFAPPPQRVLKQLKHSKHRRKIVEGLEKDARVAYQEYPSYQVNDELERSINSTCSSNGSSGSSCKGSVADSESSRHQRPREPFGIQATPYPTIMRLSRGERPKIKEHNWINDMRGLKKDEMQGSAGATPASKTTHTSIQPTRTPRLPKSSTLGIDKNNLEQEQSMHLKVDNIFLTENQDIINSQRRAENTKDPGKHTFLVPPEKQKIVSPGCQVEKNVDSNPKLMIEDTFMDKNWRYELELRLKKAREELKLQDKLLHFRSSKTAQEVLNSLQAEKQQLANHKNTASV